MQFLRDPYTHTIAAYAGFVLAMLYCCLLTIMSYMAPMKKWVNSVRAFCTIGIIISFMICKCHSLGVNHEILHFLLKLQLKLSVSVKNTAMLAWDVPHELHLPNSTNTTISNVFLKLGWRNIDPEHEVSHQIVCQ